MMSTLIRCNALLVLAAVACEPHDDTVVAQPDEATPQQSPPAEQAAVRSWPLPIPLPFPVFLGGIDDDQPEYRSTASVTAYVNGFSILAHDPRTGDLGFAAVSGVPAAGAFMAGGDADIGIVAIGGKPNTAWRQRALDLLAAGKSPDDALAELVADPEGIDGKRQIVIIDKQGRTALYTGNSVLGNGVSSFTRSRGGCTIMACQVKPDYSTIDDMFTAFENSENLPLPERLLLALRAGWTSKRNGNAATHGSQIMAKPATAAALLVFRPHAGYDDADDRLVDVRVDLSSNAVPRLIRAYHAWTQAVLGPRLLELQRRLDPKVPIYQLNLQWSKRIRRRVPLGEQ